MQVIYTDSAGKVDSKKLVSFSNKDVFNMFKTAAPGSTFEVTSEKDSNGYWQWTAAKPLGEGAATAAPTGMGKATPRSTYETPEERAKRQVYIIRQSSLSAAIDLLKHNNPKGAIAIPDVVSVARDFEEFVLVNPEPDLTESDVQ